MDPSSQCPMPRGPFEPAAPVMRLCARRTRGDSRPWPWRAQSWECSNLSYGVARYGNVGRKGRSSFVPSINGPAAASGVKLLSINGTEPKGRSPRVLDVRGGDSPGNVGDGIRTRDLRIPQERRGRVTTETL